MVDIKAGGPLVRSFAAFSPEQERELISVDASSVTNKNAPDVVAKVSSLAQQLSAAALRANERNTTLSRAQLHEKARTIIWEISLDNDSFSRAAHDSVVPKSDDPERLARAEQATDFRNGKAGNPFKELTREELDLIAYDESGDFTVNERHAALRESSDRYSVWNKQIAATLSAEGDSTGTIINSLKEILEYYKSMPVMELAAYDSDPISDTQMQIMAEAAKPTQTSAGADFKSLLDMLAESAPHSAISPADPASPEKPADDQPHQP